MATVTLTKKEYEKLLDAKLRYAFLREVLEANMFSPPPTRNSKNIIAGFRSTHKYNTKFLKSLEKGLKRSSYFTKS